MLGEVTLNELLVEVPATAVDLAEKDRELSEEELDDVIGGVAVAWIVRAE